MLLKYKYYDVNNKLRNETINVKKIESDNDYSFIIYPEDGNTFVIKYGAIINISDN